MIINDELVKKVNAADNSKLVNKTDHNAKIKNIEDKIPNMTSLAATVILTTVENKITTLSIHSKNRLWCKNIRH